MTQLLRSRVGLVAGQRWMADAAMVVVAVIWGLNNVVVKVALGGWTSPLAFNAVRFTVGAVTLTVLALLLEEDWRLPRGLWWKVALLGIIGNAMNQMLWVMGLNLSTAINSGVFNAMIPISAAFIGTVTGLDRLTLRLSVGAAICFGGILLVSFAKGGFTGFNVGDLLLLLGTSTWGGYTVFAAPLARQASPLKVTAYAMLAGSVVLLAAGFPDLMRQDWSAVPVVSWTGMLYASLCSNVIGYGMYVWCVTRMGSTRASLFTNLGPVVTALGAWFVLGERWVGFQWLGAALVFAGVAIARWDMLREVWQRK